MAAHYEAIIRDTENNWRSYNDRKLKLLHVKPMYGDIENNVGSIRNPSSSAKPSIGDLITNCVLVYKHDYGADHKPPSLPNVQQLPLNPDLDILVPAVRKLISERAPGEKTVDPLTINDFISEFEDRESAILFLCQMCQQVWVIKPEWLPGGAQYDNMLASVEPAMNYRSC